MFSIQGIVNFNGDFISHGNILIPGSYILFIDEYSPITNNFLTSNIFMVSFVDYKYPIEKIRNIGSMNHKFNTTNGRISITEHGNLHLYGFTPNSEITIRIIHAESLFELNDQLNEVKNNFELLKEENKKLQRQIEEIYYSPGMPGYFQAENDFNEKKIHES